MNKQEIQSRIKSLRKEIDHHRFLYHVHDKQEISEDALDALKHELAKLEEQYPEFITPDSPTQRIGGRPLAEFKKVKHQIKQWSFNDAFDEKEIRAFDERVKKELNRAGVKTKNVDYSVELKIDGLHVVLTYEKGKLAVGATRGDGKIGEDVTQNIKTIESLPLNLVEAVDVIVEGEVFMPKHVFDELNKKQKKLGKPLFANPRNVAAGSIRQLDSKIVAERKLDCFLYDISKGDIPATQIEELKRLQGLGFKVNKFFVHCKNIEEVVVQWKNWQNKRDKQDYWFDGLVLKVNNRAWQEKLGYTGKAPRWAIAFKFPAEQTTTVVKKITIQVGRTGALTPNAEFEPVFLAGTTVKRATLHNMDQIQRLDVREGDTVIIQKAGDIIPEVVKVLKNLRPKDSKKFVMPQVCPECGSKVSRSAGEVAYYCINDNCYAQRRRGVEHFVAKSALNIEGLGPKIIDKLFQAGLIKDSADLFELEAGDLLGMEGFKEKSSKNIIDAINDRKIIEASKFLTGLGIRMVGSGIAELVVKEIASTHWSDKKAISTQEFFNKLSSYTEENFNNIEGVGDKVSESLVSFLSDKPNKLLIKKINKHDITLKLPAVSQRNQKLANKVFVLTGSFPTLSRDQATELIKDAGGKVSGSVSKNTDFVLVGDDPGSKIVKAQSLGISIIDEKILKQMLS